MKFIFLTLLISYLIYKLLGFLLRFYVRAQITKFDPQNRTQTQNSQYTKVNTPNNSNKNPKGNSGEYIDYEIVK